MSVISTRSVSRVPAAAAAVALTVGLSACSLGHKEAHPRVGDNEAFYVDAGPITYQVQISRQLNPFQTEDAGYLKGVSPGVLAPTDQWFAVFMWAKNQTEQPQTTTNQFDITDSDGNKYYPVPIDSAMNPFAWTQERLQPGGTEPAPNTTASYGPTQGSELLFKLSDAAYSNRPLKLNIYAPGQSQPSTVLLDL